MTASDTLFYMANYSSGTKFIAGPFTNQTAVDTVYLTSQQTTISWAVGRANYNSNPHTDDINLPSTCGSSVYYKLIFP